MSAPGVPPPAAGDGVRARFKWGLLEAALAASVSTVIVVAAMVANMALLASVPQGVFILPVVLACLGVSGAAAAHLAWRSLREPGAAGWRRWRAPLIGGGVGALYVTAFIALRGGDVGWVLVASLVALAGPSAVVAADGWGRSGRGDRGARRATLLAILAAAAPLALAVWAVALGGGPYAGLSHVGAALGVQLPVSPDDCPGGSCQLPGQIHGTTIEAQLLAQPMMAIVVVGCAMVALLVSALVMAGKDGPATSR